MTSILTALVQQHVTASVATTLSRTVEKVAEELAEDLLRDPAFKAEMRELAHAAFAQTLRELRAPVSQEPKS